MSISEETRGLVIKLIGDNKTRAQIANAIGYSYDEYDRMVKKERLTRSLITGEKMPKIATDIPTFPKVTHGTDEARARLYAGRRYDKT